VAPDNVPARGGAYSGVPGLSLPSCVGSTPTPHHCLRAEPARCATAAWFWTVAGANAVTADADRASAGKLQ